MKKRKFFAYNYLIFYLFYEGNYYEGLLLHNFDKQVLNILSKNKALSYYGGYRY